MTADSLEILATHRDLVQMHQRIHQVTMEMMIYTVRFLALVLFIKKTSNTFNIQNEKQINMLHNTQCRNLEGKYEPHIRPIWLFGNTNNNYLQTN